MIVPHALGDGLCVLQAIADAVEGRSRLDYPLRGVRRRSLVPCGPTSSPSCATSRRC